jgi:hypothetical protein
MASGYRTGFPKFFMPRGPLSALGNSPLLDHLKGRLGSTN